MTTDDFEDRNRRFVRLMQESAELQAATRDWYIRASQHEYSYHFTWMGRPIIQFPQDVVAMQEIVWKVQPDLIVETGIARGGSLVFYASMLELLGGDGLVVGVDVDIRAHNRVEIEKHPMHRRMKLIQGSSVDPGIVASIKALASKRKRVLAVLDSNHTHAHVLEELKNYGPMVTKGSYLVVFDTVIEEMPPEFSKDRPWGRGNNAKTAVQEYLKTTDRFVVDREIDSKLQITAAPGGYLACVKD